MVEKASKPARKPRPKVEEIVAEAVKRAIGPLEAELAHLKAVLVNRLNFDPSAEPKDIIESGEKS